MCRQAAARLSCQELILVEKICATEISIGFNKGHHRLKIKIPATAERKTIVLNLVQTQTAPKGIS